jgi:hypothetical protein
VNTRGQLGTDTEGTYKVVKIHWYSEYHLPGNKKHIKGAERANCEEGKVRERKVKEGVIRGQGERGPGGGNVV